MQGFLKSCALLVAVGLCAGTAQAAQTAPEKVIFDTDFNAVSYTHLTLPTSDLV